MLTKATAFLFAPLLLISPFDAPAQRTPGSSITVDNFEADRLGALPGKWRWLDHRQEKMLPLAGNIEPNERLNVVSERGNKFLRAWVRDESLRITMLTGDLDWSLGTHPKLAWDWRALRLPPGAREDKGSLNDSGAAIYVSFDRKDLLGRPHSIKYVYSSTLSVGETVSHGNVKVLVVSSGADGMNTWRKVQRDVKKDYERLFRQDAPNEPFSITLWSDTDNTSSIAEVDFDNIRVLK